MGRDILEREYSAKDYEQFNRRIHDQVDILKQVIAKPEFGKEPISIGAELEMYLMNSQGDVSPVNLELLELLQDIQYQTELNKFNLELNLSPVPAKGKPFNELTKEIITKFNRLSSVASKIDTRPLAVGILPTLQERHLSKEYMTDVGRYRLLARELLKHRGEPFHIKIDGDDPVDFYSSEVCVEGANTSFQVHLMTEKDKFANTFNAAQLTLPMAVATAANSGVFLGKCLWDETRVVLFKQSIDNRVPDASGWRQPSRVTFGHGWVRKSAWELFSETVNLYQPIFPELFDDDSSGLPELAELNLHMGTTWPWNRAVYSNKGNGHLRIEFRALPAGPTALDMSANAAFSIGMAVGLEEKIDEYLSRIPFRFAEYNFYRAAKCGMRATVLWPQNYQNKPVEVPIKNIIDDMLQVASDGLSKLGVDRDERDKYLHIIQRRLSTGINGATWTKQTLRHLRKSMNSDEASSKLLDLYFENQMGGQPVSEWERIWK
ncbi:glutamate--cysteine ligase [Aliikangiella sp. G2MR2-5]|uniref:glutamate--cysteine ligase n=1 Tax=Aliikangiella sp. G2MR2-5 TaxID=2788943 RepID=UPI0018A8C7EF|nr:glutamate--cysteine ligase [Aliikangiella sp. G2MR2-5]